MSQPIRGRDTHFGFPIGPQNTNLPLEDVDHNNQKYYNNENGTLKKPNMALLGIINLVMKMTYER